MYKQRLKMLREEEDFKQEEIAQKLDCNRSTYANWESGTIDIPLTIADSLTAIYNVSLAFLLGLNDIRVIQYNQKKINYEYLLNRLNNLKKENNHTYNKIGMYIKVDRSNCYRYFKGLLEIPTDKLVFLCELYIIDIDEITGKKY